VASVPFLHAISKVTQTIATADTPQKIDIDTQKLANDIALNLDTDEVTIEEDGVYYVSITAQVAREDACNVDIPNIRFFIKNNDVDIEDSNSLVNINRHRDTKAPYSKDFLFELSENDVLTFFMSSNVDALVKIEYTDQDGEPDVPSFSLTVFKMGTDGESTCL